jgi:hypothetical protein
MTVPAAERRLRTVEFERVSSDKQELRRQAADLKRNRAQYSLEAVRTFSVKVSGTKVMSNSDVRRMYAEMSDPNIDGISVSAIDRIFRPKDFAQISEVLQFFHTHKKVIVSTVEGVVEPWTPNGWMTCMRRRAHCHADGSTDRPKRPRLLSAGRRCLGGRHGRTLRARR